MEEASWEVQRSQHVPALVPAGSGPGWVLLAPTLQLLGLLSAPSQ